jgi:hypothetical protein
MSATALYLLPLPTYHAKLTEKSISLCFEVGSVWQRPGSCTRGKRGLSICH